MGVLAALMVFLLIAPLAALIIHTITSSVGVPATLIERPLFQAAFLSLTTTSISTLLVIALGTPLAYVFARYRFPFKSVLSTLVELPIVMPPVVAGLALLMAFGRRGIFGGLLEQIGVTLPFTTAAVILAQIFVASPFYIRAAQTRFAALPRELEQAASIDGASDWQIFRNIILPLSWQALTVGLILAWARALGEFGATILFAGSLPGRTQTMPLLVYGALERDINAALWAGLVLIVLAIIALAAARWLAKRIGEGDEDEADPLS